MLQNLRGRRGQNVDLAALLAASNPQTLTLDSTSMSPAYYSSSHSGSAVSGATAPSSISLLLTARPFERPSTYRPAILRRSDDRVQLIKSFDYTVPKSLEPDESFFPSAHQQQQESDTNSTHSRAPTSSTVNFENEERIGTVPISRDNSSYGTTTQYYQSGNQPSQFNSQEDNFYRSRIIYPRGSYTYYRMIDPILRSTSLQRHQPASFARLRSFQGDQSVDSYVRY